MAQYLPLFPSSSIFSGYAAHKKPTFATIIPQPGPSGREVSNAQQTYPLWEFELPFEIFRDATQNTSPHSFLSGFSEFQTFSSFWLSRIGQFGSFIYLDPDDCSRVAETIAVGNGVTTAFTMARRWGTGNLSLLEPIGILDVRTVPIQTLNVYLNGILLPQTNNWWIGSDLRTLNFVAPPGSGVVITADFSYFFLCRFIEDSPNMSMFMPGRWENRALKFRSVFPNAANTVNAYTIDNQNTALTTAQAGQRVYFEATYISGTPGHVPCIGIAGATFQIIAPWELDVSGVGPTCAQGMWWGLGETSATGTQARGYPTQPLGFGGDVQRPNDVIGCIIDFVNQKFWVKNVTKDIAFSTDKWYGVAGPESGVTGPVTTAQMLLGLCGATWGPGGISPITGNIYILAGGGCAGATPPLASLTINPGGPFALSPLPTGTSAWGVDTLNPSDIAPHLVLYSSNLGVTTDGSTPGPNQVAEFVRSIGNRI